MMNPSASPMHQQDSEDSNEKENETTSLIQRDYLGSGKVGQKLSVNGHATRQRKTLQNGSNNNQATPHSTGSHSMSTASFSPVPVKGPLEPFDATKDHGRKFSSARYAGIMSALTRMSTTFWTADKLEDDRYYQDDFNDAPWTCTFGTHEDSGIWMNTSDQAGTILAFLVWFLLTYSCITVTLLAQTDGIPPILAMIYCIICSLALASHAKTQFTDPGAIPASAVPRNTWERSALDKTHCMCSQCQTYKPPLSHHCRICNRCISRMDHHCPWMNNCIGSGNLKHFCLFLLYSWTCSAFALSLLGWNYFFCAEDTCMFQPVLVQLVRVMTLLCMGAFLFTSSMLMNVCYGIMTGIGTIDRLKKKANNTILEAEEEPILLVDVFGIAGYWTWLLPIDPIFEDYDRVLGYSTPQRLLREQLRRSDDGMSTVSVPFSQVAPKEQFIV